MKKSNPYTACRGVVDLTPFINSKTGFFCDFCFQNVINSNKTVHGDKAQLPPISHKGLAYLSVLPDAAVTCTKQRISKIGPQTKSN